jgi:hypothetical protein
MKKPIQFRQGDVLLELVESAELGKEIPRDPQRGVVLAYGEATGHAHAIADSGATLYFGKDKAANADRFLRVLRPVSLRHDEHAPVALVPGLYRVRRPSSRIESWQKLKSFAVPTKLQGASRPKKSSVWMHMARRGFVIPYALIP